MERKPKNKQETIMQDLISEVIDIASEMKYCIRIADFSSIGGLIERWQSLGNRIEALVEDKRDVKEWSEKRKELKRELRKLTVELKDLKAQETLLVGGNKEEEED